MGWSGFLGGIAGNLIADLIFAVVVAAAAIALGSLLWRRRVRNFFDIPARKGRLPIFLSNIVVNRSGTVGTGPIVEGFHGTAISEFEYVYALDFAGTVETRPVYRALRALDPDDLLTVEPLVCTIKISPTMKALGDARHDPLSQLRRLMGSTSAVVVGAPIYNAMTYHLMEKLPSHFSFVREDRDGMPVRGVRVRNYRGNGEREYIRGPAGGGAGPGHLEYFIVEKLTWPATPGPGGGRSSKVFICAGTCSSATAAALRLLAGWPALRRQAGRHDFSILCELYLDSIEGREARPPEHEPQVMYSEIHP